MKKMINKKQSGFTLMELMIAVAIIGTISAIAYPSYVEHVKKSKRVDAKVVLLKIAQMQENYFVQNLSYAQTFQNTAGGLGLTTTAVPVDSDNGYYKVSLTKDPLNCDGTATTPCTGYMLRAARTAAQIDPFCDAFMVTETGRKYVSANGGTPGDRDVECWR